MFFFLYIFIENLNKKKMKMFIKKGEYFSISLTYFYVIYILLNISVVYGEFKTTTTTTNGDGLTTIRNKNKLINENLSSQHIQEQCIAKCPDQVCVVNCNY